MDNSTPATMKVYAGTSRGLFKIEGTDVSCVHADARGVRDLQYLNGTFFAGTRHGLLRSEDGRHWQQTGLRDYEVWQIRSGQDRTGAPLLYASTQPAGVWCSADQGASWQAINSFSEHPAAAQWCVPIDPPLPGQARAMVVREQQLWVGVEVGGIMHSSDYGDTWQLTLPGDNPDIHMLFAHPNKPDTLFVSTGYGRLDGIADMVEGNAGVFRSDDGGSSWQYIWQGITPRYSRPMCIDSRDSCAITVAAAPTAFSHYKQDGGAGACLFQSVDEGNNWVNLGDSQHNPAASNFHGLCVDPTTPSGVITGTDSGEIWQVGPQQKWRCLANELPAVISLLAV